MLKEQAKAAAIQANARAGSGAGTPRKAWKNWDGGSKGAKDHKEQAKKVRNLLILKNSFSKQCSIHIFKEKCLGYICTN